MSHTDLRSTTLDSRSLERAIEVLSGAVKEFSPTQGEMLRYQFLKVSLDMVVISYVLMWVRGLFLAALFPRSIFVTVFVVSMIAVFICLLLNVPLMSRTLQDHRKLKSLGVSDVSRSLWKASRRRRWIDRARSGLLVIVSLSFLVVGVSDIVRPVSWFHGVRRYFDYLPEFMFSVLVLLVPAYLVFAAWLLRNQREEMELAANAQQLTAALQGLRREAGAMGNIAVPARLVEQAATVEATQIAEGRRQAIIRGAGVHGRGYAIAFEDKAAEQRAALSRSERLALEELLASLSTGDAQVQGVRGSTTRVSRKVSDGGPGRSDVEVEYVLEASASVIRISAVNRVGVASLASPAGATSD